MIEALIDSLEEFINDLEERIQELQSMKGGND